ncbi:GEVED domain-containing protein [Olleya sp. Bg11-27]|uniref:GEVED domain-containing protein n=1 Tax=Olleya sp. Bg11-27 TaxID=2058135 RepID=UPI000C302D3F|nr:GEVED domain-containing protein [Olleya sp. Bg11-27]AUC74469.1 hypothetical protein CW732_01745 [Olleya sp. Bg11-27]
MKSNFNKFHIKPAVFLLFIFALKQSYSQCTPVNIGSNNQYYISNVSIESINNASNSSAANYEYYSTPTVDLLNGFTYPMVVDFATGSYNTSGLAVWIDFNHDGDFEDAGEQIYSGTMTPTVNTGSHSFSLTIPVSATVGVTRMRLSLRHNGVSSGPCTNDYQAGEFEDYNVNIGSSSAPPTAVCQNLTVSLDSNGNASIVPSDIDNGSSDDNAIATYALDLDTFDCSYIGDNAVILTVTDGDGQTDTCTSTVTVNSYSGALIAPTLADVTASCSYTVPTPADLSYGCVAVTPVFDSSTSGSTTFTNDGTITWLYDDGAGNADTVTQNVYINLVAPSNILVSSITQTSATIVWDDALGDQTYSVRYKESGDLLWTTIAVTTNTLNLTGLTDLTNYDVEVATVCGINTSNYSATYNFTTLPVNNACVPTSNSNGQYYITNVYVSGENLTEINNTSGDDGGYGDYTATPSVDLTRGQNYSVELSVSNNAASNNNSGWAVYIDLNGDGDLVNGEMVWNSSGQDNSLSNTDNTFDPATITIPATAVLGKVLMRVGTRRYWHASNPCGNTDGQPEEFEDYIVDIKSDATAQEIDVYGNSVNIISGTTVTTADNYTYFGVYDINSGVTTRTFVIENSGVADLVLQAPYVNITGSTTFSVASQPTLTTLIPGESTTFLIAFNPDSIATFTAGVSVLSNDLDENPFVFTVQGEGAQTFPDTDGDGVPDNIDIDDDNDGLSDAYESASCTSYPNASTTDVVFLNETFGAGTNRIQINGNYAGATTTYCYEDGSGSCPSTYDSTSVNDGDYTVHHTVTNNNGVTEGIDVDVSAWAEDYWYAGADHTLGDVNGRMAIFNAAADPGVFYSQEISGVTIGVPIQFGFYAINLDRTDAPSVSGRPKPEVSITIYDNLGNQIATESSGLINPTSPAGDWVEVSASFTSSVSQFTVVLTNSQSGGSGNDLAIDDIFVKQTFCDLDGDGVADLIDLDNDNDGIPNVVELGYVDDNFDATVYNDVTNTWIDANGNGMHDVYEGLIALDSDGDGIPNHMDLDSDNDGIFDSVEYNGLGDIDIDGDGVGDGTDYQDTIVNNTTDDPDGDGILPSVDDNDTDVDGISDTDHGTFNYDVPLDTDGDGVPDYLDIDSNDAANDVSNGSDISNTIYSQLDTNNDGVVDGNIDVDLDGILDAFDSDNSIFGSPRDLENSYSLFFDGRNDYVEDATVLPNGNATLMAWVKSEGSNTLNTNRIVAGQTNFYLLVNSADNTVSVVLNGSVVLTSTDVVVNGVWAHITATTNGSGTVLYINGQAQGSPAGSGGMSNDTSNFTIGRLANNDSNYFHGEIDEVRVFNISLTEEEVQRTVYQELDENQNFNQGKIIPKDISGNSIGANLVRYYKMDGYKGDITDNKVTPGIDQITGAKLYNIKNIYFQTAPLPYKTIQDGPWTTVANWEHGDVWDIDVVANNKDWSIVQIDNNISTVASHTNLGLVVKDAQTFTVTDDNYINNTWYLEINGTIDLLEDSQIIQTTQSDLVTDNDGNIFRRQEGLANKYRYNYWGSPVGKTQATSISDNNLSTNTSNSAFNLSLLKDNVFTPMEFTTSYDELGKISTYWTYIYQSGVSYYSWVNIGAAYDVPSGFGYIHKGTGIGTTDFQYIFDGKPNNGTIIVSATDTGGAGSVGGTSRTTSLLGNPYPSALGVGAFINDNSAVIGGELYLWEQWGGDSHVLNQYQGGYATVNLTAGIRAYQFVGLNGDTTGGIAGVKTPESYLSVGQGFIVEVLNDGDIEFNNSQRVFKKEALGESVFFRQSQVENQMASITDENPIKKIRLQLTTANDLGREIVMGFNSATNDDFDYGFDAKAYETFPNDLTMTLDNNPMVIQSYADITADKVVALNFEADGSGMYSIQAIEFVDFPTDQEVFLRDNFNNIYYDLTSDQAYSFASEAGVFADRFDVVFQSAETLSTDGFEMDIDNVSVFYLDTQDLLFVKGLNVTVKGLKLYNTLGQQVYNSTSVTNQLLENGLSLTNLSTGLYVVSITMENNQTLEKKIILK